MDCQQWNRFIAIHPLQPFAVYPQQAVVGSHPDLARAVLVHSSHEVVGEAIFAGKSAEGAVAVTDESASLAADPERIIASDLQAKDVVVGKSGIVFAVV